jgi:hypothetical protein
MPAYGRKEFTMNPEIKEEWLKRLRSGDYQQYKGYLKYLNNSKQTCHCCLGVLVEIQIDKGGFLQPEWSEPNNEDENYTFYFNNEKSMTSMIGSSTLEWASIDGLEIAEHLAVMNDQGFTFAEIADAIEAGVLPALDDV